MSTTDEPLPERLRDYVGSVERALEQAGVEGLARHGIVRDLESQIAEMRTEEGMTDDEILKSLDAPAVFAEACGEKRLTPHEPAERKKTIPSLSDSRGRAFYGFVAALSIITILIEAVTHISAMEFFDPMPTYWHFGILVIVPPSVFLTAVALGSGNAARYASWLFFANGFLVFISLAYSAAYVRIMPFALLAILYLGLGLLPLSPSLVLVASVCQGMQLRRLAARAGLGGKRKYWLAGFILPLLMLGGWTGYVHLVEDAMRMAKEHEAETRRAGLDRLRLLRAENHVLAGCHIRYSRFQRETDAIRSNRILYYRLTGRDYREEEKPFGYFLSVVDEEIGGVSVGAGSGNVALCGAAYDISIASGGDGNDAGPGVAYAELTLEFANQGQWQEEARCQIIMPPEAVASRLTLWIDGEEREAAFGKRSAVREAYGKVVSRRRDPALLTAAGPARVLLQCFPILPKGTMRVKVGFSLPLSPEAGDAALWLPYIAERNFSYALENGVSIWAECDAPMSGNGSLRDDAATTDKPKSRRHAIRRRVMPDELAMARIGVRLPKSPTTYSASLAGRAAVSELLAEQPHKERLAAVVLDVSRQNKVLWASDGKESPLKSILKNVPRGCSVALFAGKAAIAPASPEEAMETWPRALAENSFEGADEQIGNLEQAWDACDDEPNAVILWIHDTMPVDIAQTDGLAQRLRRRPPSAGGPTIYSLQMRPGANRIEERLAGLEGLVRLPPRFDVPAGERLADLFANLAYPALLRKRYAFSLIENADADGERYGHVVRLASAQKTERLLADPAGKATESQNAVAEALRLRLVTSATGAVVLENAAQYNEYDLDPAATPDSVPTIPEPEEWAMLAIAVTTAAILFYRKKQREAFL